MLTRRLLGLSGGLRLHLVLLVLLGLGVTATYVGQGLLIARVIAGVFTGDALAAMFVPLLGVVGLQAVRVVLLWLREERAMVTAGLVKERVRRRLYGRLLELGPGYVIRERTGTVTSTFVDGVEALEKYFAVFVPQVFMSIIGAAVIALIIVILDPVVGAIVIVCAALVPLAPRLSRRLMGGTSKEWWRLYREIYAENLDAVQGMGTLKAFGATEQRAADLHAQAEAFSKASIRLTLVSVMFLGIVGVAESAGTALSVGVGALRLADGALLVGGLLTILLLAREAFRPLHDLQAAFHQAYAAFTTSEGILAVLDAEPEVPHGGARIAQLPSELDIRFTDVGFRYREDGPQALNGLSFHVAPQETVALVGRSGAGKTTVVSLLLRFFQTQEGRIEVGGTDVRQIPPEQLRSLIAVVAQDSYLFHGSVRRNLLLGRPEASDAELEAAACAAEAHDFISRLPQGYETIVGERGLKLSGGERQRITIARALLKDAPLLILDEATSSIDSANEAAILRALERLTAGRTTLVIAHRLSTVRHADRIIVMEAGRAVEAGAHPELLERRGTYARLVAAQEGAA